MRVLLVQPDYVRQVDAPEVMKKRLLPGRSLLQLKSVLEEAGHQVTVLDPLVALNNTKKGRKLDLAKAAADLARDNDFNAAGISIYTPLRKEAHDIAKALKRVNRTLPIIAGGPHPGRLAESMLKGWKELDYICLGAAEKSLPSLLSSIAKKKKPIRVDDIAYRTGPETVRVKGKPDYHADMASLPLPGYESYLETVPDRSIERAYVMTMRGCPYWCNFCSNLWKKVLLADPGSVAREVEYLVKEAGAKSIVIYDDCFGAKLEHSREVLEKIGNLGLDFELQAVTRFDTISDEWLPLFREAGGTAVLAGLETGSVKLRKKMNKHMKEGALCEGAELVRKAGLKLAVYLLFGYPSETDEDVQATSRMIKKLDPEQVMSSVFDIKPGDLLFEFAVNGRFIQREDWLREEPRFFNDLTRDELMLAAARAEAFDRTFTKSVIVPEHDPVGALVSVDSEELENIIAQEQERWG